MISLILVQGAGHTGQFTRQLLFSDVTLLQHIVEIHVVFDPTSIPHELKNNETNLIKSDTLIPIIMAI